ncbi:MAG: hypothetical protein QGH76_07290 [Phycisphaerales bacterium]|nr:hypothetical protein [Phycisphaerales bacterium]
MRRLMLVMLALVLLLLSGFGLGCAAAGFLGAAAQQFEDQKLVEKLPEYEGLEDRSVAVVIDMDLAIHYEHPGVASIIAEGVSARIQKEVPGVKVLHPGVVAQWQFRTPQWSAMPPGDIATALHVDRVVYIDLQAYRLTPHGNTWLWEGFSKGSIGIVEAGSFDGDGFADSLEVEAAFPTRPNTLARSEANEDDIGRGLLQAFIQKVAWLFYTHTEPKHPDRYRPELDA